MRPIERPRIDARIEQAARFPVALLIAPAGYGKSVALSQYLGGCSRHVRFNVTATQARLRSFVRGFAQAASAVAPHALTTLADAYEHHRDAQARCSGLASWMATHLGAFRGTIAIDDLHVADSDPDVAAFVVELIAQTKERVTWILSSRSTGALPLGTWLAYGDCDLPVSERDLQLTLEEAKEAARRLDLRAGDAEIADLLELTGGWPAGMGFALRGSVRAADLTAVRVHTREMIYRFLAEQVYAQLDEAERALLDVAVVLPAIEPRVLELAGFDDALQVVERLRARAAFLHEEEPGRYRCHELFAEFVRRQLELRGGSALRAAYERGARALEASGDVEHALDAFARSSRRDVLRLLRLHGFEVLERVGVGATTRAIASLDEAERRDDAYILALRGALAGSAGKIARAQALLRRAIASAQHDPELAASASLRLARLIANRGEEVGAVLQPIAENSACSVSRRAEAYALIAAQTAVRGETQRSRSARASAEQLLMEIHADATRARVLQHVGIAAAYVGDDSTAADALSAAVELSAELHLYGIRSRACASLSNLVAHRDGALAMRRAYAQHAWEAAAKAGDAHDLSVALLQLLATEMRCGDAERCQAIEREIARVGGTMDAYVTQFAALRAAWEGRFSEAHRLLEPTWHRLHHDSDRAVTAAYCALFMALDGLERQASSLALEAAEIALLATHERAYHGRNAAAALAACALAQAISGRFVVALRLLSRVARRDDGVVQTVLAFAEMAISGLRLGRIDDAEAQRYVERLEALSYADVARLFGAVLARLSQMAPGTTDGTLTACEREILGLLATGMQTKAIASKTQRSVHTVRAHIANALAKLRCHGRGEAVVLARARGII
jgi:ATP/maltotriose-dependent transcriptional regulator MalT